MNPRSGYALSPSPRLRVNSSRRKSGRVEGLVRRSPTGPPKPGGRRRKGEGGFTLIEMVVAVAVATMLVVGVSSALHATKEVADRQQARAREQATRARAIEVLRRDFRGRVKVKGDAAPRLAGLEDWTVFICSTTADSILTGDAKRGVREARYVASGGGLEREESGSAGKAKTTLADGGVTMEFWDGRAWRRELKNDEVYALRVAFLSPPEVVVIR